MGPFQDLSAAQSEIWDWAGGAGLLHPPRASLDALCLGPLNPWPLYSWLTKEFCSILKHPQYFCKILDLTLLMCPGDFTTRVRKGPFQLFLSYVIFSGPVSHAFWHKFLSLE